MMVKISLTTHCNAKCKTCPVWEYPGENMSLENFKLLWDKLNNAHFISKILLNSTGDLYVHPQRDEIIDYIEANKKKYVCMTTNAGEMHRVPKIDEIVVSFNGGTKETYEYTTGLNYDKVVKRLKENYDDLRKIPIVQMHCLMWEGNEGTENDLKEAFQDFPGRLRVSYKYDNQFKEDKTLKEYKVEKRIQCDYLGMIIIMPNGDVVQCSHDFEGKTVFANAFYDTITYCVDNSKRLSKIREHKNHEFNGLCKDCNYNTPIGGKIKWL